MMVDYFKIKEITKTLHLISVPGQNSQLTELISRVEKDEQAASLATILFDLGEGASGIDTVVSLKRARECFLNHALLRNGLGEKERHIYEKWLMDLESRIEALLRSKGKQVKIPQVSEDRLEYFLYRVTALHLYKKPEIRRKVQALTPTLYSVLRKRLYREIESGHRDTISDDLPNQLTILIHYFPSDRILNDHLVIGGIRLKDIRFAFESYRQTDTGAAEQETIDRYERQVADLLGFNKKSETEAPEILDESWRKKLGVQDKGRILLMNLPARRIDEEDEIVVYAENEDRLEHPLENSYRIKFGELKRPVHDRRAIYDSSIHDVRVLTRGEIVWLCQKMDELLISENYFRLPLLLWLILVTGMTAKRILNLRISTKGDYARIVQEEDDFPEESPTFMFHEAGLILARATEALDSFSDNSVSLISPCYKERSRFIPLYIGSRGIRYAAPILHSTKSSGSQYAFPNPEDPSKPMTLDHLHGVMRFLNENKPVLPHLLLSWSRLAETARPYSELIEGGTLLIYALSSGRPSHPEAVRLHYIAYNCQQFHHDHGRILGTIEALVDRAGGRSEKLEGRGFTPDPLKIIPELKDLFEKNIGAAYAPHSEIVKNAWRTIQNKQCDWVNASVTQQQYNLGTIRGAFALMLNEGIRDQELKDIKLDGLDLNSRVLRITGKANKYFQESREIPLTAMAVEEMTNYLNLKSRLGNQVAPYLFTFMGESDQPQQLLPGGIDKLIRQAGFAENELILSVRTLRHALRTAIHETDGDYKAVNEFFGHVVQESSCTHHLSGHRYNVVQGSFRSSAEKAVAQLLT